MKAHRLHAVGMLRSQSQCVFGSDGEADDRCPADSNRVEDRDRVRREF